jgi:hypothetical protein
VILAALALTYRVLGVEKPNPWPLLAFAFAATATWLVVKAESTIGYLFPVLENAFNQTIKTAAGETAPRSLFHSSSTGVEIAGTPVGARLVALAGVALLGIAALIGIREFLKRRRWEPLPVIFVIASLLFFGALALRFAPAAWETGNRAGEFLFIGLSFVVAGAIYQALRRRGDVARWRVATALGLGVVLLSGAISGWPWDSQLARPIRVSAEGSTIESEPLALAEWSAKNLPDRRFAAPEADGRLLLTPGGKVALTGQGPDIEDIVGEPGFPTWQEQILRDNNIRYVVADRREIASDNVRGYFFTVPGSGSDGLLPIGVVHKFSRFPAARIYDSGRIVLFDLKNQP